MVIHKRVAKAIKKRRPKKGKVKHDLPAISDIPAFFPYPGLGMAALKSPGLASAVATYLIMEATQPYWGPPVEAHGQKMRQQYDAFIDEYFGSRGPRGSLPALRQPGFPEMPAMATPKALIPPTRKVSKANKAMKKAYAWLLKGHKGKMTQKKCRELLKKAARMASKANPGTKSRIGKRTSKMLKECMKIRKNTWNRSKRY